MTAYAQPTDFSLPPLPPPGASGVLQPPAAAATTTSIPPASLKPAQQAPAGTGTVPLAIPELATLPKPVATTTTAPANTTATTDEGADEGKAAEPPAELAVNPPMAMPEQSEGASIPAPIGAPSLPALNAPPGMSTPTTTTPTPPPLAGLPLAGLPAPAGTSLPIGSPSNTSTIPPVDVSVDESYDMKEAPPVKTWMTKLAPTAVPPSTSFNYRRQILPDAIYKRSYDRENRHLPTVVTMEDYTNQFLLAVAKNDVDGARALMNRGVSPHTATRDGESALQMARRLGANDTARLLEARGAM